VKNKFQESICAEGMSKNMSATKMKLGYERSILEIPYVFIDEYMTDCLPVYPLIYIWSLRRLLDGESTGFTEIAERFRLTEGDVISAWKHWESQGLITMNSDEITFLPVKARRQHSEVLPVILNEAPGESKKPEVESRPQYTAQELACYRNQSQDIERLFSRAEKTLGKLLSYNDMNVLFGCHDWLRLPIDVIEYLLIYCEENEHRNLRYIEKCAIDWADNNINDIEKAITYVRTFDKNYRQILKHMGQTSGYPTPAHRKYMDKWLDTWQMPLELILEACDRCVEQIAKPNFKYIDKILADRHKKGILTLEGVTAADAEFMKVLRPAVASPLAKPKQNRFINFNQREKDYSQIEKLEREYLQKKYKISE